MLERDVHLRHAREELLSVLTTAKIQKRMKIVDARLETGIEFLAVDVLHWGSGSGRA